MLRHLRPLLSGHWIFSLWLTVAMIAIVAKACLHDEPPPLTEVSDDDLYCLALSLYWEARGEGRDGMVAVGSVVLNRMRHESFPDSPCKVVYEGGETPPCQFSWWCDGKSDRPRSATSWAKARELAQELLTDPPPDPTEGALFFHSVNMEAPWRIERTRTVQIGRHVYYR